MHFKRIVRHFFGLVLVIIVLVGFLGGLWAFAHRTWDGQTRFTIINLRPHLVVKSFDPVSKKGIVINFPDNLEIESVSGRGSWMAGVIGRAGEEKWAADSVANYLGITYTLVSTSRGWDSFLWSWQSRSVDWSIVEVADTSLLSKSSAPDGLETYHLSSTWDNKAKDWFYDQKIASQLLGVTIVNTTETSGLGANASRVVGSMGFKVRSLTTSNETPQTTCVVRTRLALKNNLATKKLQKSFACKWEVHDDSDIELVLGNLYRSWKMGD